MVIMIILNQGRERNIPHTICQFRWVYLLELGLGLLLPDLQGDRTVK